MKKFFIALILPLFLSSSSFAGIYSSSYSQDNSSIIASVELEEMGIVNLIVSIAFLSKPQDSKIYKSDEYNKLLQRLQLEWKGVALQKILESKRLRRSDLVILKNRIHTEIEILIEQLTKKLIPGQDAEVVFAISNFYLLEPRER
ncbi:hypothetical protein [Desulfospira joergensenii]|uniref:hypothetical protein n=1 Tax=Desulfospira joergensenii TaxID=53329 RepID=UPI0004154DF3|nr:hypothetical protein [Desulfospira joergensenii]